MIRLQQKKLSGIHNTSKLLNLCDDIYARFCPE